MARHPAGVKYGDPAGECAKCKDVRVWRPCGGKRSHIWRRYCLTCARNYRPRYVRELQYFRDWALRRRGDPAKRALTMWQGARDRAAKKGLEFSISKERVLDALNHGFCEVTGLQFELRAGGHFDRNPLGPTIDRIDSKMGYTESNVQVVCWIYNLAKSNWSHEDIMVMVRALSETKLRLVA